MDETYDDRRRQAAPALTPPSAPAQAPVAPSVEPPAPSPPHPPARPTYSVDVGQVGIDAPMLVRVGRYTLKRQIAAGGMGTVYEAVQEQPRRTVALKLMRGGAGSRVNHRRFEFESQLLARLRHPGIAQVYEAGTHQHGDVAWPFYAMEFVPGARTITAYADEAKLSLRQRVELFAGVCDAIDHAHDKGIIHRDIKPGNILVDADGQVKVIDFGVARAADSDEVSPTLQTVADQLIGTLQYMSPEQCQGHPAELDRRSDVYSLSVVLYELVCGKLPYFLTKTNLSDAARVIREEPPAPPRAVKPDVPADLETVLLKGLHKDRAQRYATAGDLATDLRRFLAGEPITARRDSISYVLRRRTTAALSAHRISAAIGATVVAVLLAQVARLAMYAWTDVDRRYIAMVTSRVPTADAPAALRYVRVVALRDDTNVSELAADEHIAGFDPSVRTSLRAVHGRLMKRLADADAAVVAWDIGFRAPSPYDGAFIDGVRAMRARGRDVIVAAADAWSVGADGRPATLSATLAPEVRYGFTTAGMAADAPWSLELLLRRQASVPLPSLALAAAASYWRPGVPVSFDFNRQENGAALNYPTPATAPAGEANSAGRHAPQQDLVGLSKIWFQQDPPVEPDSPHRVGDTTGLFLLTMPSDAVLADATVGYGDVFRASPEQLRAWFEGRVVVVGDFRSTAPDRAFGHPDGRKLAGPYGQAIGIEQVLADRTISLSFFVTPGMGFFIDHQRAVEVLAPLAGAAVVLLSRRGSRVRRGGLLLLGGVFVAGSFLLYYEARVLLNPIVAVIGMLSAAWLVSGIERAHAKRLT